jgi:hypothetical protein
MFFNKPKKDDGG